MLDRNLRQRAIHEGKKRLLDDDIETAPRLAHHFDFLGQRRHKAVGKKDPGKRPDQGGSDQAAEKLGRLVDRPHCLDDAKDRRHDFKRRKAFGHGHQGTVRLELAANERVDFLVHQRFDFVRPRTSHNNQAKVIADEMHQGPVGQHRREPLEDLRR